MPKLAKNILYNLIGQGGMAILSLVAAKTTFRQLGEDVFGIFLLGNTIVLVIAGLSRGSLNTVVVREIARYHGSDANYARKVTQTASITYWGIFALFVVLIYFGSPWMVRNWIHLSGFPPVDAVGLLRIVAIGAMFSIPSMLVDSYLRGLEEMKYSNFTDLFVGVVYRSGLILLISWGADWKQAAWWFFGTNALGVAILYLAVLRFMPTPWLQPRFFGEVFARNTALIRQMSVLAVTGLIHRNADKIIVSRLMPISHFGYYSFAYGFIARASIVQGAVASATLPAFSRMIQAGNDRQIREHFEMIHSVLIYGLVPFFAAICFAAGPLYTYIFSADVAALMLLPTALLTVGSYMSVTMATPLSVALASGRGDINMRGSLYALVVMLPATILLIYYFGLVGGGISWIVFWSFIYVYSVPRICRDCLNIPAMDWYAQVGIVALCTLSTYGVAWVASSYMGNSIEHLLLAFVSAPVVYALIAYRLLPPSVRAKIHRLVSTFQSQLHWPVRQSREV